MEAYFVLLAIAAVLVFLGGSVCGLVAVVWLSNVNRRLEQFQYDLHCLRDEVHKYKSSAAESAAEPARPPAASPERPIPSGPPAPALVKEAAPPERVRPVEIAPSVVPPPIKPAAPAPSAPAVARPAVGLAPARGADLASFELTVGIKWLAWVGIVLTLIGGALFLKYAYDNNWIGPRGRLAIGAIAGGVAMGLGERFRRKDWPVMFQVLTGGGIAAFYICIFFSFQIYELTGQGVSMALASCVTLLAIALAVARNAVAIAILGLIGGFLSPVLLTTGENHPYGLFSFIAILDVVALGAAYFRRWRALDVLSFAGTALIYQGWYLKFYGAPGEPSQMLPALLFTTLFYVMFLLIPTLHSLVRRVPGAVEGVIVIAANALFSFFCYCNVLFEDYRHALGLVVLGQALLVFGLFQTWRRRVDKRDPMSECLLVIAMALVTIAVPIELKLYAIPIAWALEGVVFVYIGLRFNRLLVRAAGVIGLGLAACGLLWRLPMHTERFIVVFNVPFGSWAAVIAAATCAAYLLTRAEDDTSRPILVGLAGLLAFALGSLLLSLESFEFWTEYRPGYYRVHLMSSLVVLWALIPGITATVLAHKKLAAWAPLALVCYAIGGAMFFGGFVYYDSPSTWFALNAVFPLRLLFVIALWWGGMLMRRCGPEHSGDVLTVTGHALLTILLAVEIHRWGNYCTWLSDRMAVSFISAAWGIQAFVLLWVGLATRNRARRVVGFALFGLTVAKVCFYDLGSLERVYQIVSFLASGLLLLLGCYFYHRYSPMLLGEEKKEGIEQT